MEAHYCECPAGDVKVAIADNHCEIEIVDPYKRRLAFFVYLDLLTHVSLILLLNDIVSIFYAFFLIYFSSEVEHDSRDNVRFCLVLEYVFMVMNMLNTGYITYYMIKSHDFIYQIMPFIYVPLFTKFGILYCGSELKFLKDEMVL